MKLPALLMLCFLTTCSTSDIGEGEPPSGNSAGAASIQMSGVGTGPAGSPCSWAETPSDLSFEGLVPVELEAGLGFLEGPVWVGPAAGPGDGALHFSNFDGTGANGRIRRYVPSTGALSLFLDGVGINGMASDASGGIIAASHELQALVRFQLEAPVVELLPGSAVFDGKPFNSTNDVVVRGDGHVYFTDPTYQRGQRPGQDVQGYYHRSPGGKTQRLGTLEQPNGIALSPDGSMLYVSGTGQQDALFRHSLGTDGSVGLGVKLRDERSDGMAVDCAGNLYLTVGWANMGRVVILDPSGMLLGEISGFTGTPTNAAFGGTTRRTLYVTSNDSLWSVEMPLAGMPN